ncbi:MAG: protein SCO1/2 [Chitinophagales bacterium]|jgi:protein SCO1/2
MLPLQSTQKPAQSGQSYFLIILIAIVAIGSGILVQSSKAPPAERPEFKKIILLPNTKPLVTVDFKDHNGQPFGLDQFKGKWSVLFFGFTNCPDVCPTTMQTLKQVKSDLEQAGVWHNYQVIMVSVDPERDTSERLSKYVPYFDPEFIGITGPLESTTSFSRNFGILFFKGKEVVNGGYDVDHGAAIILVNPEGQYAGVITAPHIQATISEDLIDLAKYAGVEPTIARNTSAKKQAVPTDANDSKVDSKMHGLVIENAWIRPAPPGVQSMAAYFDLHNNSKKDIVIVNSGSSAFSMAMIHNTVIEDGVASMNHLDQLLIPAMGKISLSPLGTHMMLMGPKQELGLGDSAEIELVAKDGRKFLHTVTVKPQVSN